MKLCVPAAAWCFVASSAVALEAHDIHGTWRLASATRKIVDTNETLDAYGGPRPSGWLTYGKDGRMMVICAFEGRTKPIANDKMTDEDRIHLHKTFFAYAGTYTLDGQRITHAIDTSWNEAWSGTSQVRDVELKDGQDHPDDPSLQVQRRRQDEHSHPRLGAVPSMIAPAWGGSRAGLAEPRPVLRRQKSREADRMKVRGDATVTKVPVVSQ